MKDDLFTRARQFLLDSFPTKAFLPALGVKLVTLHEYKNRGLMSFESVGRGKVLYLKGTEILYARCLCILSMSGGNPKYQTKGLHDIVIGEFLPFIQFMYSENLKDEMKTIPPFFAFYCFVDNYNCNFINANEIEGEWKSYCTGVNDVCMYRDVFNKETRKPYDVEAHGDKAVPFWIFLNLTDILLDLSQKVYCSQ